MHNPNGRTYRAEVVNVRYEVAEDGRPIARATLRLLDPEADGVEAEWFGLLDAKSIRKTVRTLRILGFEPEKLDEVGGIGTVVLVELLTEVDYYGDLRVYITNVGPQGDNVLGAARQLDDATRAKLIRIISSMNGVRHDP